MLHNRRKIECHGSHCDVGVIVNPKVKTTLALFIEKAEELTQEEFTVFLREFGHRLNYQYTSESQELTVSTLAPTETMNKSFILTYRMFIQANEGIGLLNPTRPISPILLDASLSSEWRDQVQDVAGKIHAHLLQQPMVQINVKLVDEQGSQTTEVLTRWDILDTLIYGQYAHTTKRKRLQNWLSTPYAEVFREMPMVEFRNIVVFTLGGIHHLVPYARKELEISL